ncbi:MAG: Vitamin B12 dependent methionine synthase activation subunit [Clostridia bacterium]|nr:Vitamin B12 dependent methionine synthase activation subunit [Clostridia bacterium]
MIDNLVFVKSFSLPPVDRRETLRYAGVREEIPEITSLLDSCIVEVDGRLSAKVCYREYELSTLDAYLDLGFARTDSRALRKALDGCKKIILFCATVGVDMDRLIARYSIASPSRSVMLQAIGTERVETLCDEFCKQIKEEKISFGQSVTKRFSPGYSDLPLALQRDIFSALNPEARIGVVLNESLIMTPSKSVTAIIGIKM